MIFYLMVSLSATEWEVRSSVGNEWWGRDYRRCKETEGGMK